MTEPRRIRETRALYARVPDSNLRVNSPDGFAHDFAALAVPESSSDVDGIGGAWWLNDGDEPWTQTTGSPLTERVNGARGDRAKGSVLPAITRCSTILVNAVVRTRWLYHDSAGAPIPRPLWVHDPMLLGKAPGPVFALQPIGKRLDGQSFWSSILADAILFGRGAFVFLENADGAPTPGSLVPLNPLMIDVDDAGYVTLDRWGKYPLRTDWDGRFQMGADTWRVAILPGLFPNRQGWPEGVLLRHFSTFRLGASIGRYLEGMYASGVPSGYLSVSTPNFGSVIVDDPERAGQRIRESDLLKRDWMQAHGRGRRSVAVLNSSVAYTPISISPVDSDAAKLVSASRTDMAHAFGMSSVWLDEGMSGLAYSNASERRADLVSMTAASWGEKLTGLVSSLMPYGTDCAVNWSTFVGPSMETMLPALVQAVQAGIFTAGEARQQLGYTPWAGPDPAFIDASPAAGARPLAITQEVPA